MLGQSLFFQEGRKIAFIFASYCLNDTGQFSRKLTEEIKIKMAVLSHWAVKCRRFVNGSTRPVLMAAGSASYRMSIKYMRA